MLDALSAEPLSGSSWAPISDGEKMTFRILLPAEFQDIHRRAALAWVRRGHEFSREDTLRGRRLPYTFYIVSLTQAHR